MAKKRQACVSLMSDYFVSPEQCDDPNATGRRKIASLRRVQSAPLTGYDEESGCK
jgi:hypothetical protein